MADVVASRCPDIAVGERLYGFFPMASHLIMTPGNIRPQGFSDMQPIVRTTRMYNHYARTGPSRALQAVEDERCVYFPLFMTGYVIADLLRTTTGLVPSKSSSARCPQRPVLTGQFFEGIRVSGAGGRADLCR